MLDFAEEEDEEALRKRKVPLPKLDLAETGEKAKERLEKIKTTVPSDKESLFKSKVRWDGLTDVRLSIIRPRILVSDPRARP